MRLSHMHIPRIAESAPSEQVLLHSFVTKESFVYSVFVDDSFHDTKLSTLSIAFHLSLVRQCFLLPCLGW